MSYGDTMDHVMTIEIDADAPRVAHDRMIFGGFLEHFGCQVYGGVFDPGSPLSDKSGFRLDVIEALKELRVPIVRWPGGCYVSGYHWEDGIGRNRTPTDDMAWGVREPHTFGTDEFIEFCRLIECEPYICNNAGNGTISEMSDWVEYCNASDGSYARMRRDNGYYEPRNVIFWSIGNENWGQHEIGYKPIEQWAPLVAAAAARMKRVDPRIRLSAAALPTREWTVPLLEQAGNDLDYVSIHGYWLPLWQDNVMPDYLTCIMESDGPEERIVQAIAGLDDSGHRGRVKIAFDEWNLRGWHHPGFPRKQISDYEDPKVVALVRAREKNLIASQYTIADALFSASFLNACLRHADDVGMANIAPIVNTRGPLHVHPEGIVKRPHFHTLSMYADLLFDQIVEAKIGSTPLEHNGRTVSVGDAIATADRDGKGWSISVMNRHPTQWMECEIEIAGRPVEGRYEATVLSGGSSDAYNDIDHPDTIVPVKGQMVFKNGFVRLAPQSLSIVQLPQT